MNKPTAIFLAAFCCFAINNSQFAIGQEKASKDGASSNATDDAKKQNTRKLIQQYFPDLEEATLNGWVETYSSMDQQELTSLLKQRKMLGQDGAPAQIDLPSFELDISILPNGSPPDSPKPQSVFDEARQIVTANLAGLLVAGHRSRGFFFLRSAEGSPSGKPLNLQTHWDLTVGPIIRTGRRLDMAFVASNSAMFRLEPGTRLTRCGHFTRLPSGLLGQKVGGQFLTLTPEIRVPDREQRFSFDASGQLISEDSESGASVGQGISVVDIKDASLLQSDDGVYFYVDEQHRDAAFAVQSAVQIQSGAIELSNAVVEKQLRLKHHVEMMQESISGRTPVPKLGVLDEQSTP